MSGELVFRGVAPAAGANELIDAMYPAGSVVTINTTYASGLSGATFPEQGAFGGLFLAFDKASTESAVFALGSFVPITWRTVDLYLETFHFFGDPGGSNAVRWSVNVNFGGEAVTTQTVTADIIQPIFKIGGQTYTLASSTVNGVAKYGATVVVSRIGGNGADTLDADSYVSSLHVVRVT